MTFSSAGLNNRFTEVEQATKKLFTDPRWVPKKERAAVKAAGEEGCLDKNYTDVLVRAASKRFNLKERIVRESLRKRLDYVRDKFEAKRDL